MSLLGQFLELSIPSEDVPASLAFYRALGFTEARVADIRPWFHAAVTDGQVLMACMVAGWSSLHCALSGRSWKGTCLC